MWSKLSDEEAKVTVETNERRERLRLMSCAAYLLGIEAEKFEGEQG